MYKNWVAICIVSFIFMLSTVLIIIEKIGVKQKISKLFLAIATLLSSFFSPNVFEPPAPKVLNPIPSQEQADNNKIAPKVESRGQKTQKIIGPKDARAYYLEGCNQSLLGNYKKAIECFTEAIRLNPKYQEAYTNRAKAHHMLSDYKNAYNDLYQAYCLFKYDVRLHEKNYYPHQGNWSRCQFTPNPIYKQAYHSKGKLHTIFGTYKDAYDDLYQAYCFLDEKKKPDMLRVRKDFGGAYERPREEIALKDKEIYWDRS
jgi:tetratricopeptide (TPR) repeat protein